MPRPKKKPDKCEHCFEMGCDDDIAPSNPAQMYINVTTLTGTLLVRLALCYSCALNCGLVSQGDINAAEKEEAS